MKKYLRILSVSVIFIVMLFAVSQMAVSAHPFEDVPEWADSYVEKVYSKGIMNGTGETTFGASGTLTREQLVVTLYRLSGSRITGSLETLSEIFTDAADISDWAYNAVTWAYEEGITSGVAQGENLYFKPKSNVTRQETSKFFVTYIEYKELEAPTDNVAELKDMDTVAAWALPYVEKCIAAGIINGDGNGNFDPTGEMVRAAAAKMVTCIPVRKSSKMIAHRGYSNVEQQNTIPAFIAAGERSYYGIECDIWVTADNEFAVIHNQTTTDVTNGAYNVNVSESTWEQISEVIVPDLDGSTDRGLKIPKVEEYIEICKEYNTVPILELKGNYTREQLQILFDKIASLDYLEETTFICFSWDICVAIREMLPDNDIFWLTEEDFRNEMLDRLVEYRIDININQKHFYKPHVENAHLRGVRFAVWTCDDPEAAEKYRDWGVDFITTNWLEYPMPEELPEGEENTETVTE